MTAIREFVKVDDHMLHIKLPDYFDYKEVEIEIGMNSGISDKSHEEIFENIKAKYED